MTAKYKQIRDKQIRKEANSYYYKIYAYEDNRRDYFGSAYDEGFIDAICQTVETAFIAGAMWADEHPDEKFIQMLTKCLIIKPSRK